MSGEHDSAGQRLRWARERGWKEAADFARVAGLNDKTYRAYENDQNGYSKRAGEFAKLLNVPVEWLLVGGPYPNTAPPIVDEIPEQNALVFRMEDGGGLRMYRDVPIYGTALGADEIIDGEAIEQTTLNRAEVTEYRKRPPILNGRADVYGLTVQGSSMSPLFKDGRTVLVEERKRPAIGDDAVIYMRGPDGNDGEQIERVLIKHVVGKTASHVELEQYNPAKTFKLPMERVYRMDRVLTLDDIIG